MASPARPQRLALREPEPPLADGVVSLRRWRDGDAGCLEEAATDPVIPRYTTVPPTYDASAARTYVRRQWRRVETGEGLSLAIARGSDDAAVGSVVLLARPQADVVGIGYWLVPRVRGGGLATRAVTLLAGWAIDVLGIVRVEAWVEPGNVASERVLARAAFVREGVLRSFLVLADGRSDATVFARVAGSGGQAPNP